MSSATLNLDPDEYPEGSQKRQEKLRELEELLPDPVPEEEWSKNGLGETQEAG